MVWEEDSLRGLHSLRYPHAHVSTFFESRKYLFGGHPKNKNIDQENAYLPRAGKIEIIVSMQPTRKSLIPFIRTEIRKAAW